MKAIRKQVYITPENQEALRRITARRKTTEASVVRRAIEYLDQLEHEKCETDARLRALGVRVPDPAAEWAFEETEEERWRKYDARMAHVGPIRLSEAVWEDREGLPL